MGPNCVLQPGAGIAFNCGSVVDLLGLTPANMVFLSDTLMECILAMNVVLAICLLISFAKTPRDEAPKPHNAIQPTKIVHLSTWRARRRLAPPEAPGQPRRRAG